MHGCVQTNLDAGYSSARAAIALATSMEGSHEETPNNFNAGEHHRLRAAAWCLQQQRQP
jgi:hypothetical protein